MVPRKRQFIIGFVLLTIMISTLSLLPGCSKKDDGVIKIGAILTLSGKNAQYGQSSKNAIDLAVQQVNESNELSGKKLEVQFEDDQQDPKASISAFKKLVSSKVIKVIIGPLTSTSALAVAPLAEESHVVVISPSASSPQLSQAGDYFFRNVASDEFETRVMAEYLVDSLKMKRVGVIHINNDFGVGYNYYFKLFFEEMGGVVPITVEYNESDSDFRTQLSKLKQDNLEAIYLIGYKEMGLVIRQARELNMLFPFFSYSAIEDPDILTQSGGAANGVVYTRQSFDPHDPDSSVMTFSDSYFDLYGEYPDAFAALSYDALRLIVVAMKEEGFESEDIKKGLYGITDFKGVTGLTSFDVNGDVTKSISIKIINGDGFDFIVPNYFNPNE